MRQGRHDTKLEQRSESGTHAARLPEDVRLGRRASPPSTVMQQQYEEYVQRRRRYCRLEGRWLDWRFLRSHHRAGTDSRRGDAPSSSRDRCWRG
ncbi:MAG TPA: hypothetical protein VIX73_31710, partial [Kofleriaceae bacterium]